MTIRIVEVGPRDGLQNEKAIIPTDVKVAFVDALSRCGFAEIEVSSFVSPKWVPQLADATEVFARITRRPGTVYSALVPNAAGLARAAEAGVDKIAVFTAASETFTRRNINATIAESIERFREVIARATVPVRGYLSTAFHCPYEGPIAPDAVVRVAQRLLDVGCLEVSIGDTIGKATPDEVEDVCSALAPVVPIDRLAMHFHDTFGRAVANAERAAAVGVTTFDSSAGGIGGCPYAPGASGNVSTQALIERFGAATGLDRAAVDRAAAIVQPWLGGA
ncbi:MAG: hydroxymethylglutaryl-CoA lyase [Gemmatimonadetes bacterium]|nr:hydroxymethylglutaryl-CoA lyase [Gemmatimonadota bacterium]